MERGTRPVADAAAPKAVPKAAPRTVPARLFQWPQDPKVAVAAGFEVVEEADPTVSAVPDPGVLERFATMIRGGGKYRVGQPYEIAGKLYEPKEQPGYDRTGVASWYGSDFHGRLTANGEIFDRSSITAAHPTLPLPSYVRVTNLKNNRSIVVRVNDRGPFKDDRLIDVSEQTAALLGFRRNGTTKVRVEYISKAPLHDDDKAWLLASYQGPASAPRPAVASLFDASTKPVAARAFAFVPEPRPRPAEIAIRKLSQSMPTAERIRLAFEAARGAEED